MLAVATAQGPPVDAAQEKIDDAPDGSVMGPDGAVLLPPTSTEGTVKFVHSMVTTQADMIAEMVDKVCEKRRERNRTHTTRPHPFSSHLSPHPTPTLHHRSTPACTAPSWA